jgi:hypothetical protein
VPSEIEYLLALPSDTWGFLEWSTGVLRINATYSEFTNIDKLPNDEKSSYEETISHEMFHRCQICTAGYLYNFTIGIIKRAYPVVYPYLQSLLAHIKQAPQSNENITVIGFRDLWLPIVENPPHPPESLLARLNDIDEMGSDGVTIRSIVESSAYLIQKQMHINNLRAEQYRDLVKYTPSAEYSFAYLLADSILGERAFDVFQVVAFISLCFAKPHLVFVKLCEQFKQSETHSLDDKGKEKVSEIIDNLREQYEFIGTTLDLTHNYSQNIHPFYKETLRKVFRLSVGQNRSIPELMARPEVWFGDFRTVVGSPVILNPDEIVILDSSNSKREFSSDGRVSILHTIFAFIYALALVKKDSLGFRYIALRK